MSIKVKTLIAQDTFTVGLGVDLCYIEDVLNNMTVQGDGGTRTLQGWMDYIVSTFVASYPASTVSNNITDYEYSSFDNVNEVESKHADFSEYSGFPFNMTVNPAIGPGRAFGTLWGTYRLVISGSENSINAYKSILETAMKESLPFANNTYYFVGKKPIQTYRRNQDKIIYRFKSAWVGEEHDEEIKDFFDVIIDGDGEVKIYNVDRPDNSDNWYFDFKTYSGLNNNDSDMMNRRLVDFEFNLLEV